MSYYYPGASITYEEKGRYYTATVTEVDEDKLKLVVEGGKEVRYGQVAYHNGPAPEDSRRSAMGFKKGF